MRLFKILLLILFITFSSTLNAQKKTPLDTINCNLFQNDFLLKGKHFASTRPILLRVFNEDYEYAALQLGKRKRKIFLYFKIFTDNVCVKQKQPLELYFENGDLYVLKNKFKVNCDGTAALQLSKKDIKKINANKINKIKLFTLEKDYDFSPTDTDNITLKNYLACLKYYKIK
ncbi:hypothetical protein GON26_20430 [Flavobacterium sp. GA093]|uniref:Uncharacterized protein n=1 Tax=Flavobacterium hydrocarbonoxydans TaxID=2683249 RepID=A0A6I4NQR4_9FLAO|nr:hypothetical protein [Flavobacterium hydrocarbonoxydans]MWB96736.1 hypothetical protein [Flavobacterium hydrocarbonoxydans]